MRPAARARLSLGAEVGRREVTGDRPLSRPHRCVAQNSSWAGAPWAPSSEVTTPFAIPANHRARRDLLPLSFGLGVALVVHGRGGSCLPEID